MSYAWILIIISTAGGYVDGSTVHSVPGFQNQAACQKAADAWVDAAKKAGARGRAFCASTL